LLRGRLLFLIRYTAIEMCLILLRNIVSDMRMYVGNIFQGFTANVQQQYFCLLLKGVQIIRPLLSGAL
jgi:hypothetical protein